MKGIYLAIISVLILASCTRKEIEFGTIPENAYTSIAYIDTVSAQLSTVLLDSFKTNADTSFLLGRYYDPYLGTISAKPFFQMSVPASLPDIPSSAILDSLSLIIKPNKYYYGDTSRLQTVAVYELAQPISFTYNNQLYNTSDIQVKPVPLGSRVIKISPSNTDSFTIRLSDERAIALFNKVKQKTSDVTTQSEFLNYLYGLSIGTAVNDIGAVIGLKGTDASFVMRLHYHLTVPYPEPAFVDFTSLANEYAFTQVLPDRTGTGLSVLTPGVSEISPALTNGRAFLQPGSGITLKMIFPTLRGVLNRENNGMVKLLKAELIVKPKELSSDLFIYKLPAALSLAQTDATNLVGNNVLDSTGLATLIATPTIDQVYGVNNYYRFNVTQYINQMLTTTGMERSGFYLMQQASTARIMDRLVVEAAGGKEAGVMLLLYVLNINN
ncbi:DUF4270 domain-containing protein [Terrimonas sp. NA20]|uniref:DUF4270 domain-containing protein n=1 Tax=Terrimonas ginsenosidimutans TaxID=2908004 RepID=A0ABS9KNJ8_9BACT|nr:DUF4270 family protein [Terrimonas ginsenosidimutans]MCG2613886.1 DUF4270 domain-containing protein [Terrimonas ginsenosidimutans]